MIQLFRISKSQYINDLSGMGARLYGGRWNSAGYPVVYSSGSRSLAALEFLVHTPMVLAPDNLSIVEINIKKNVKRELLTENQLPRHWRDTPAPEQLAILGSEWIKSQSSLLLEVPSVVVDKEINTLINPMHPDIKFVKIAKIERFSFDSRLFE